ncbi:MAG: ribonuclease R [Deltaproteobacteria bacterium]|nr:ribonuclease R [Deltaproteobacteria bacterium]
MPLRPETLVSFLREKASHPVTARELVKRLRVPKASEPEFLALLQSLAETGEVVEIKGGRYAHPSRVGLVVGRLQVHPDGFGFVVAEDPDQPDVFIKPRWLKAAMHGDRVVARIERRPPKGPEGRIIRILQRANPRVIGVVRVRRKAAVVAPLEERLLHEIYVAPDDLGGAADGQIVEVEITAFPTDEAGPEGRVVHVLGHRGDASAEAKAVALKHGIPVAFPPEVLEAAEGVPTKVRAADRRGREDLRELPFVTIDGETAKDFDDALVLEELDRGRVRLRVAIADVSHYVTPGSPLDDEAFGRGTSTYFPDRVFPMLPERLSNGICSLNPGVDRLALVADLVFSRGGRRQEARFYPAVIRSRHRLTYTTVARILDDPDCDEAQELADVTPMLLRMGELARAVRARRRERGSIDFDLPEAEIVLDVQGRPEDIVRSRRNEAHFLVEEFMIAANEAVADFLTKRRIPCPYRVHDAPDPEKLAEFRKFVHNFGYTLKGRARVHSKDFQHLLAQVEGKPEERMIHNMMLRTMAKAVYSPDNVGHFGLASERYLHFTSPIRRYPDLIVHRELKKALQKRPASKTWRQKERRYLEEACPHLSTRERAAEAAEREAVQWKKCQFMADKVGSEHWGFVVGVASFGFFVELETYFVDGLVHVSSLEDDFYHFSEETQALIGERTGRTFRIGDRVRVRVDRVSVARRQIDFVLAEKPRP